MLIERLFRLLQSEGIYGVKRRLDARLHRLRYSFLYALKPKVVRSAYGIRLRGNWNDKTFKFYVRGAYGDFFSRFLKEQSESFIFLDIGANQGLYSIIANSNPHCKSVYAFEPVPRTAFLLRENLILNKCTKVTIVNKAISDTVDVIPISHNPKHTGNTSLQGRGGLNADHEEILIETINYTIIDQIIQGDNNRLIIKIDVEGHEAIVIDELIKSSIFRDISDIFYECDEGWISADYIKGRLIENGLTIFTQVGSGKHYDVLAQRNLSVFDPAI